MWPSPPSPLHFTIFTIRGLLWLTLVVALAGAVRHAEGGHPGDCGDLASLPARLPMECSAG